jgi:hypothetical protein
MPNIAAIRSVGSSLADYLDHAYRASLFPPGVTRPNCTFSVVSSGQMQTQDDPSNQAVQVLIYLYRVSIDGHLRNAGRPGAPDVQPVALPVNLHYLFTFWSTSADSEHLVLAWTLRQLHLTPLLDASILGREADWGADEFVHIVAADLSNEDMMRVWDALRPDYRLSIAYDARVVRLHPDQVVEAGPVVASRFQQAVPAARA